MDGDGQIGKGALDQIECGIAQLAFSTKEFDFHLSPRRNETNLFQARSVGLGEWFQLFDQAAHIAQTARTLRISQIARALVGLNACVDVVENGETSFVRGGVNFADAMFEAVTHQDILRVRFFLINTLADILNGKCLRAIG